MPFRIFLRDVYREWSAHQAPRLAAAVAYHTLFSLAPVLLIAIAVAGLFFGGEAARHGALEQIARLLGENGAKGVESLLIGFQDKEKSAAAVAVGGLVLLWGASNVFVSLRESLDFIWDLKRKPGVGIQGFIKERMASFALVLGVGFVLLVSLLLSAGLVAFRQSLASFFSLPPALFPFLDLVISFLVVGLLFTLIFKLLPSAVLGWRDAASGAAVSALLFIAGKFLLGLYLGRSGAASAYGAAGSVVLILLWVNYSAQGLFVGAAVIKARARLKSGSLRPGPTAQSAAHCPVPGAAA